MQELAKLDQDPNVGCMILTGNEKSFAVGADIKEMHQQTYPETYTKGLLGGWDMGNIKKPVIAAVRGFALGGGCELAMMCDIIYATERTRFGQPEIKLGIIPGCGGTQRLVKAIGKAKAMEMILTGGMFSSQQAEAWGLVAQVVKGDDLLPLAKKTAKTIAGYSKPAVFLAKECVNASFNMTLDSGIQFEKRMFQSCFASLD